MIRIGMTGTQEGMTPEQQVSMRTYLSQFPKFVGHHGKCVGADVQFDAIASQCLGFEWMEIHPCSLLDKQGQVTLRPRDIYHPVLGPLQRNEVIVKMCHRLVATPKEQQMQLRSGTWTTVRYAMKWNKRVDVIMPNGAIVLWSPGA